MLGIGVAEGSNVAVAAGPTVVRVASGVAVSDGALIVAEAVAIAVFVAFGVSVGLIRFICAADIVGVETGVPVTVGVVVGSG